MNINSAAKRVALAHAYVASVVEGGENEYAQRVGQLNEAPSLSANAAEVRNAEALAALAGEVAGLREQVAELPAKKASSASKKKA